MPIMKIQSKRLLNLLKRIMNILQSIRTNLAKRKLSGQANQPITLLNNTFHQSINTVPYKAFYEVIISGNTNLLTISGTPTGEQLNEAWSVIEQEYSDAVQTKKTKSIFDLAKKILNNRWQLSLIDMCVYILKQQYCETSAGALLDLGYPFVENLEDREQYLTQIYAIETEAKFLIILQNQYNNEYKNLTGGEKAPVERTAIDYEKELRIISKYVGYSIKSDQITVFEFISYLNMFIEANTKEDAT